MTVVISANTLTEAWFLDLEHLVQVNEQQQQNLVTTIANPDLRLANVGIIAVLDEALRSRGKHTVNTVANTIFPKALYRDNGDRQYLYDCYLKCLPYLKKQRGNEKGTYFGRLIQYPSNRIQGSAEPINQIELIIEKIRA